MKLISNKFNFNSTLASIVIGEPDGVVRECLIDYLDLDKDQQLINHAFDVEQASNAKVFMSVKFPYGSRPKRIEMVFKVDEFIVLCKFTNSKRVDEAALELQTIISTAKGNTNDQLYRGLVIYPDNKQKVITDKFATNQLPDIRYEDIKNLKSGKFSGIFNQSKSGG
jgi:hypothetical protein